MPHTNDPSLHNRVDHNRGPPNTNHPSNTYSGTEKGKAASNVVRRPYTDIFPSRTKVNESRDQSGPLEVKPYQNTPRYAGLSDDSQHYSGKDNHANRQPHSHNQDYTEHAQASHRNMDQSYRSLARQPPPDLDQPSETFSQPLPPHQYGHQYSDDYSPREEGEPDPGYAYTGYAPYQYDYSTHFDQRTHAPNPAEEDLYNLEYNPDQPEDFTNQPGDIEENLDLYDDDCPQVYQSPFPTAVKFESMDIDSKEDYLLRKLAELKICLDSFEELCKERLEPDSSALLEKLDYVTFTQRHIDSLAEELESRDPKSFQHIFEQIELLKVGITREMPQMTPLEGHPQIGPATTVYNYARQPPTRNLKEPEVYHLARVQGDPNAPYYSNEPQYSHYVWQHGTPPGFGGDYEYQMGLTSKNPTDFGQDFDPNYFPPRNYQSHFQPQQDYQNYQATLEYPPHLEGGHTPHVMYPPSHYDHIAPLHTPDLSELEKRHSDPGSNPLRTTQTSNNKEQVAKKPHEKKRPILSESLSEHNEGELAEKPSNRKDYERIPGVEDRYRKEGESVSEYGSYVKRDRKYIPSREEPPAWQSNTRGSKPQQSVQNSYPVLARDPRPTEFSGNPSKYSHQSYQAPYEQNEQGQMSEVNDRSKLANNKAKPPLARPDPISPPESQRSKDQPSAREQLIPRASPPAYKEELAMWIERALSEMHKMKESTFKQYFEFHKPLGVGKRFLSKQENPNDLSLIELCLDCNTIAFVLKRFNGLSEREKIEFFYEIKKHLRTLVFKVSGHPLMKTILFMSTLL